MYTYSIYTYICVRISTFQVELESCNFWVQCLPWWLPSYSQSHELSLSGPCPWWWQAPRSRVWAVWSCPCKAQLIDPRWTQTHTGLVRLFLPRTGNLVLTWYLNWVIWRDLFKFPWCLPLQGLPGQLLLIASESPHNCFNKPPFFMSLSVTCHQKNLPN